MAFLQTLSERVGNVVRWLTLIMVVVMTAVVVLRYGFNVGWIAMQESVLYLHAFVLMLGIPTVLKLDQHVRVDIFYRQFSKHKQNKVNLFGDLIFLIPSCLFIIVMSWDYVIQSWQILEQSQETGGLPLVFILKSLLLATPILLLMQVLADFPNRIAQLFHSVDGGE